MEIKVINKRVGLVTVLRNKRKGVIIRAIESSYPLGNCRKCWMYGKGCSINGKLCWNVVAQLGKPSVMFVRV